MRVFAGQHIHFRQEKVRADLLALQQGENGAIRQIAQGKMSAAERAGTANAVDHMGERAQIHIHHQIHAGNNVHRQLVADEGAARRNRAGGLAAKENRRGFRCAGSADGHTGQLGGFGSKKIVKAQAYGRAANAHFEYVAQGDILCILRRLRIGNGRGSAPGGCPFLIHHTVLRVCQRAARWLM